MVEIANTPKSKDDPFGDAFAELTNEGDPTIAPKTDAVTEAAQADVDATAAAEDAAKPTVEIEGVLPDPKTVAADGKAPVDPAPAPAVDAAPADTKLSDAELLARFRDIVKEPIAPAPPVAPSNEPEVPTKAQGAISEYTPQQKQLVDDYIREWPDVYHAEQLIRAREYQALTQHIFNQLAPVLQSLQGQTTTMAVQSHLEQLHAAVPDFAEVAPKVVAWVEEQPAYLKAAFKHVVDQGSVADVTDLINRYRAASGEAAPALQPATASAAPPAAKPPVAKLVKGLAPVSTKRTGVQTDAIALDDFDGAFTAFAKAS